MAEWPRGTVAFLFTDLEGSTRLWREHPSVMPAAYARHDAILREAVSRHGGVVYKVIGDAMQIVFPSAPAAVAAALEAQRELVAEAWPTPEPLRIRMALHAGAVDPDADGDYRSPVLNRLGRLLSAGHGGQVLLSAAVQELVWESLPDGVTLRDLGEHRFKDLEQPSRVYQLLHADLPGAFPPLQTAVRHPHNLVVQATPFLGREQEVAAVVETLRRPEVRLLTLTGPGGAGKTRISLEAAALLLDDFADGIWVVDLAPLADPGTIPAAIANAVGARGSGEMPLETTLKTYLGDKHLLLVLDNVEHLHAGAAFAGELLAAAPRLKVLATSRVPLRLRGERELVVPPLAVPDPRRRESLEQLSQYDAVRLFVARAQDVRADFAVDNANAPAVAEICYRLDGLPLAIELAAARVKLLSPEALLRRLEQRLPLLASQTRDVPERQRTLRAAIAWSHDLLAPPHQRLYGRLAVFAGGFTLETAEAVANPDGALDIFAELEALVDHSLVRQTTDAGGEPRFSMLETIREFGLEQLDTSGETAETRRRHAEVFRDLAEQAEGHFGGPRQERWLARLDGELENVRAALATAVALPDRTTALRIASAMREVWELRGLFAEGVAWLERALDQAPPSTERVRALAAAAALVFKQGDLDRTEAFGAASLALARELDDEPGIALALTALGTAAKSRGDLARAETLLGEALAIRRRRGDTRGESDALNQLTITVRNMGDFARATSLQEDVLRAARAAGDQRRTAIALVNLALLARDRGEPHAAPGLLEEALDLARGLDDKPTMVIALGLLGLAMIDAGEPPRAAPFLEEAFALLAQLGDRKTSIWVLEVLARAAALAHLPEQSCHIYSAAEALRDGIGAPMPAVEREAYDRDVAALRADMTNDAFRQAWDAGRGMPWDHLMAEAQTLASDLGRQIANPAVGAMG